MKKAMRFLVVVAFASLPACAFAADGVPEGDGLKTGNPGVGEGFVDADGDGICDHYAVQDGQQLKYAHRKGAAASAGKGPGAKQARQKTGDAVMAMKGEGDGQALGQMARKGDGECTADQSRDWTRDRVKDQVRLSK